MLFIYSAWGSNGDPGPRSRNRGHPSRLNWSSGPQYFIKYTTDRLR